MLDWGYWRWQIIRNVPLAAVVALLVFASGWVVLDAIPPKYTASARIVLERQFGISSTSKAQRTSEDVQHLQVVIYAVRTSLGSMNSDSDLVESETSFDLTIESSRDKPTVLLVKSTLPDSSSAIAFTHSLSDRAIGISDAVQQAHIDDTLNVLRAKLDANQARLVQAQGTLNARRDDAPEFETENLQKLAARLRSDLHAIAVGQVPDGPALGQLYDDLATARGLYSELHPKVRLLQSRIEHALSLRNSSHHQDQIRIKLREQIETVDAQVAASKAYQTALQQIELEVTNAAAATQNAQDVLSAAEVTSRANRMHLKVVQATSLIGRDPEKIRAGLFIAVTLGALFAAIGAIAVRVKFDRHIRRPRDLQRTLGLTPFATLPDLGPSLG
jgi:capsular polysaccharide biosynthesis protein